MKKFNLIFTIITLCITIPAFAVDIGETDPNGWTGLDGFESIPVTTAMEFGINGFNDWITIANHGTNTPYPQSPADDDLDPPAIPSNVVDMAGDRNHVLEINENYFHTTAKTMYNIADGDTATVGYRFMLNQPDDTFSDAVNGWNYTPADSEMTSGGQWGDMAAYVIQGSPDSMTFRGRNGSAGPNQALEDSLASPIVLSDDIWYQLWAELDRSPDGIDADTVSYFIQGGIYPTRSQMFFPGAAASTNYRKQLADPIITWAHFSGGGNQQGTTIWFDDFVVSDGLNANDIPKVIPEPASLIPLIFASLFLIRRKL